MRGLLEKDICLLRKKQKYLLALIAIYFWCGALMDSSFIIMYMPLIVTLIVMSTFGSDEADNGMAFLMTLPCTPADYVKEKYTVNICFGMITSVLAIVVRIVSSIVQGTDETILNCVHAGVITVPIWVLLMAVLLPINLKFGNSKGQIVVFIIWGIMIVAALFGSKLLGSLGLDFTELLNKLFTTPAWLLCIALILISVCALLISSTISIKIMNNKEY